MKLRLLPFYLLVIVLPLIHVPFFNASAFSAPKLLILRILTLVILGMWGWRAFQEGRISCRKSLFNILLVVMGVVAGVTTIFSDFPFTSLFGIDGRFVGLFTVWNLLLLAFFVFNAFTKVEEVWRLVKVSLIVTVITAVYGILQSQGWFNEATRGFFNWGVDPLDRSFSTFGHSTHFAVYLGLHLPVAAALIFGGKGRVGWLGGAGFAIISWALFTTGSRGGLFAAIAGLFIMCGILVGMKWETVKKHLGRVAVILAISLVFAMGLAEHYSASQLTTFRRLEVLIEDVKGGKTVDRQSWWASSFEMFSDRPFFGHGLSTFADIYNHYRRTDYRVPADEQDYIVPHYAHMDYFNILATQGLAGLGAYLALVGYVLYTGARFLRKVARGRRDDRLPVLALLTGIIVYLLHVLWSFGVISTLSLFYLFMGLTMVVAEPKKRLREFRIPGKTVGILIAGIMVIGLLLTARVYLADIFKARGEHLPFDERERAYEQAISLLPYEYSYYSALADLLVKKAQISVDIAYCSRALKKALGYYEKSLEINDGHPSIYNHMGIAYSELSKLARENDDAKNLAYYLEEAAKAHKKAVELGVNNPIYTYDLANFYARNGMKKEAREYYGRTLEIREGFRDAKERMWKE